jgi:hypothetical protein
VFGWVLGIGERKWRVVEGMKREKDEGETEGLLRKEYLRLVDQGS